MLNKKSLKKVIISVLALTMVLGTVVFAAEGIYTKKLTATYGRIRFNYEGSDVTSQIESAYGTPAFVTEGRSYVPVRAIADLVGVDIDYDNTNHIVKITDPKIAAHKSQLDDKDAEIAKLKAEVEKLKKEEKKAEEAKKDLKSLESSLNKKYSEYEKVEFDIVLKESGNKITIDVTTNLGNTRDEQNWLRMKYSDKKYFMEDLVDQVKKDFKDADISGTIYDSFSRRNLHTFKLNNNGTVSITDGYYGGYNDYYGCNDGYVDSRVRSEFDSKYIYDARLTKLDYRGRNIDFEIDFPTKYKKEWDDLLVSQIESMLDYISDGIDSNYDYDYGYGYSDDIYGRIYSGSELLGTYTRDFRYNTRGRFTPSK